ncbi:MAG: winged helix-turn-helix domain-containing protein, partial [Candidatus Sulfotelmatobacter sp.]
MMNKKGRLYEFGPFLIDPVHRLLLRDNQSVPLQPKAFDILLALVENGESVVLKSDLLKAVWPDTFVEESNLAQNIFVLRKALGDNVGENHYIVTVPGRGYRLAETVRTIDDDKVEDKLVIESRSRARMVIEERGVEDVSRSTLRGLPAGNSSPFKIIGLLVLVIIALAAAYFYTRRAPKLTSKDTIVLAYFDNRTEDPVFDGTLRQALSAQLEQSPFLNLLSDQRAAQALALMGRPKNTPLSHDLAHEVCQRTGSTAVLDGSIAQIGTRYLITLRAVNCVDGETLASTEAQADDESHVLDALGKVATQIRSKLGESLASVQKYDVPPENVTTPSLEALKTYTLAHEAQVANHTAESVPLYERAISQDPNFAMAYLGLGISDFNLGEMSEAADNVRKAYDLRAPMSEREKLGIELIYDAVVTGNFDSSLKADLLCTQIYPRDARVLGNLAEFYGYLGDYEKSLAAGQDALMLNPGS